MKLIFLNIFLELLLSASILLKFIPYGAYRILCPEGENSFAVSQSIGFETFRFEVVKTDAKRRSKYMLCKHVRSHDFSTYADLCRSRKLATLKQCYRGIAKYIEKSLHSLSFAEHILASSLSCVLAKH